MLSFIKENGSLIALLGIFIQTVIFICNYISNVNKQANEIIIEFIKERLGYSEINFHSPKQHYLDHSYSKNTKQELFKWIKYQVSPLIVKLFIKLKFLFIIKIKEDDK